MHIVFLVLSFFVIFCMFLAGAGLVGITFGTIFVIIFMAIYAVISINKGIKKEAEEVKAILERIDMRQ